MKMDHWVSIFVTLGLVALATTLVLPGRQTPQVIGATFSGASKLTSASLGK